MDGFLIFALVAGVVIVLAIVGAIKQSQRRKELLAWAAAKGLHFSQEHIGGLDARFPAFSCLRQGDNRYAYNTISGDWNGRRLFGFDYHYATHSTDSKGRRRTHHHHFSAVILDSDLPLKPLFLRPEGFFDKVTEFFGADDIDFESAEFSRKFYVKAPDRRWAFDVIHQRTMEFLLARPQYSMQFDLGCVMAWTGGVFSVAQFANAADTIAGVLDRLPEYVKRQQAGAVI